MNDNDLILSLLQTLHYRKDLEESLMSSLLKFSDNEISTDNLLNIYGKRVHPELLKITESILMDFGVIKEHDQKYFINGERLKRFMALFEMAKNARDYHWPELNRQPYIYVSPPSIIGQELAGDIDDIANLIINLISSAKTEITLVSPFTNDEGLKAILLPLANLKESIKITAYFSAEERDVHLISTQVRKLIPEKIHNRLKIFFCIIDEKDYDILPHAKTIIVDNSVGYLGSANFTRQGLNTRFELGVKLVEKQCIAIEKLLNLLVEKGIYTEQKQL